MLKLKYYSQVHIIVEYHIKQNFQTTRNTQKTANRTEQLTNCIKLIQLKYCDGAPTKRNFSPSKQRS